MKKLALVGALLAVGYVVIVFGLLTLGSSVFRMDDIHFYE